MSPAAAASAAVAARARGPSCFTRSVRVSGPRLLLSTTPWPASTASRATVLPMFPLPMSPMVVTFAASPVPAEPFQARRSWPGPVSDLTGSSGWRAGPAQRPARLTPVVVADLDDGDYLASMLGEDTNWVRNVRAAQGRVVLRHGTSEPVRLVEVDVADRARILPTPSRPSSRWTGHPGKRTVCVPTV